MGYVDLVGVSVQAPKIRRVSHLERDPKQYPKTDRPDVLIYQPGRVGSNTVYEIVRKQLKENTHHLHTLGMQAKSRQWDLPDRIASRQETFRVITLVREPLARNLSAWKSFFNCRTNFVEEFDHDHILNWFDNEIKQYIGIDVFEYPFDKQTGWMTIKVDRLYPLLIIRQENIDQVADAAIRGVIPLKDPSIEITVPRKAVSEPYEIPKLPDWLIDKMLQSRYCKHFYTDEEIQSFYEKYQ